MKFSLSKLLGPYRVSDDEEHSRVFRYFLDRPMGFFVDVGANDGSYTLRFEEEGWSGILIEPLPDVAEKLRGSRKATVVECLAGSRDEAGSTQQLYRGRNTELSTLYPNDHLVFEIADVIERPVRTLDSILQEHAAPEGFDFLKIDVELHELAVAMGFDFARWAPRLIIIEDHAYNRRLHRYITGQGYKYFQRINHNNWYVPKGSPDRTTLLMRYAFFRKFYLGLPTRIAKRAINRARNRRLRSDLGRFPIAGAAGSTLAADQSPPALVARRGKADGNSLPARRVRPAKIRP